MLMATSAIGAAKTATNKFVRVNLTQTQVGKNIATCPEATSSGTCATLRIAEGLTDHPPRMIRWWLVMTASRHYNNNIIDC